MMLDLFAMHHFHLLIEVPLDAAQNMLFDVQQIRDVLTVLPLQILNRLIALRNQQPFQTRDCCHDKLDLILVTVSTISI